MRAREASRTAGALLDCTLTGGAADLAYADLLITSQSEVRVWWAGSGLPECSVAGLADFHTVRGRQQNGRRRKETVFILP